MTRVSKERRKAFQEKYEEYEAKYKLYMTNGNYPNRDVYKHKMKAMRTSLGLLGIYIKGINGK